MKGFLKVIGAAALIAGFTPYHVSGDKEKGTWSAKALLWQAERTPGDEEKDSSVVVNFGFKAPAKKEDEEAQLFSDELTVEYSVGQKAAAEEESSEATAPAPVEEAESAEEAPAGETAEEKTPSDE